MRVRAPGEELELVVEERLGERVGVRADLPLVLAERLGGRDLEAGSLRRDRVLEGAALHAWENGLVDGLGPLLRAEDEPAARPGERLVRRRRDEVTMRRRI